jgi:hypothetical protein
LGNKRDKTDAYISQAIDGLANLLEQGRTAENPFISWPMKLVVPFLRTPMRIAQISGEASPLGWIGPKLNQESFAQERYKKSFNKLTDYEKMSINEDIKNRKGLASIGTMVTLMGVGAAITGNTTWSPPQDPEAKKLFYASGRRPYSFRVGNRWIPMMYLGPAFLAFALPAAARDAFADNPNKINESVISKLGYAVAGIPKIILSQTPLSGVSGLMDALQGKIDTTTASAIGFQTGQFVPASGLLGWINKIVDPVYQKPVTIGETIKARIPGLSKDIEAYKDEMDLDAKRSWTDIYLPYTVGKVEPQKEEWYQSKMELLKERMKFAKEKKKLIKEEKRQPR